MRGNWDDAICCRSGNDLEQAGRAHAAADAHGDDAVLCLTAPPFDQNVAGKPCSGHAVGTPQRDGAAVDVELFWVDAELVPAIDHLYRVGLVQLPQIDIVDLQ